MNRCICVVASTSMALFGAATLRAQSVYAGRRDTVDLTVGSSVIDFSKHTPGTSRAWQSRIMNGDTASAPPILWHFAFSDTGSRPLLFVRSEPEQPPPNMPPQPSYVFDRKTLALREVRDTSGKAMVTIDGPRIRGEMRGRGGIMPIDLTLAAPAFYQPLADLVAESLPRRVGVVYRIPLWGPGSQASEVHLYEVARREDVTVRGKKYSQAWVIEDRTADGSKLLGTMWLVDAAPHLVRWVFYQPNGTVTLDQEVAPRPLSTVPLSRTCAP